MAWRKMIVCVSLLGLLPSFALAAPPVEAPRAPTLSVSADPAPSKPAPAPVVLEGKNLFHIRESVLGSSPAERARNISARLEALVKNRMFIPDRIKVVNEEGVYAITAEGKLLMAVFEHDAAAEGVTVAALAERYAEGIRAAVEMHNRNFSFRGLLFGAIYAFVATVLLVGSLLLCRRLFPRIYAGIRAWGETRIRTIKVGSYEVLRANHLLGFLVTLVRWFRILTTFILVYLWFLYVLSLFPWTRGVASTIIGYILAPLRDFGAALLAFLPDLFVLAFIWVVTRYFIKLARLFFSEVERGRIVFPRFYPDWAMPTFNIVRFFIVAFAVTVAFPYIPGSKSEAFKGVSIFLGVLFSLGSTAAIANVMGGLSITYMRAFNVGDRVRIGDTVGDVIDKSLLVTHLRTIKNEDVTVPNSIVLNSHIVNYSARAKEGGLILHTSVTIGYDAPWRRVQELLVEAARRTPGILSMPEPFVLQTSLNDFYVTYELNAYTNEPLKMDNLYSELHRNIQDAFNEAGVEIMSPHYTQLRDGNRTAIPDSYLPPGYRPRVIRVEQVAGSEEDGGPGRLGEKKPSAE